MNSIELSKVMQRCLVAGQVPLLLGQPGCGKSDLSRQVALALGWEYLAVFPALCLPEHFQGFPFMGEDGLADFKPLGWLRRLVEANAPILVLLDEIDKAMPAVQSVVAQLVLARTVGSYALPDCVRFALAGNRPEHRAGGQRLVNQLVDRCALYGLEIEVDAWLAWADAHGVRPDIRSFISRHPDSLSNFKADRVGRNSSPRSWAMLSAYQDAGAGAELSVEEASGFIADADAALYARWGSCLASLPTLEQIVRKPGECAVPGKQDGAFAVAAMLVARADKPNVEAVCEYLRRLAPDICNYAMTALRKRDSNLACNCGQYLAWARDEGVKIL